MDRTVNQTPLDEHWGEFARALHRRLEAGQREYGDDSFARPAEELLGELQQEALDLAGWGFVLWTRLQRLSRRVEEGEGAGGPVTGSVTKPRG